MVECLIVARVLLLQNRIWDLCLRLWLIEGNSSNLNLNGHCREE
jgi:hypothetical protein